MREVRDLVAACNSLVDVVLAQAKAICEIAAIVGFDGTNERMVRDMAARAELSAQFARSIINDVRMELLQ